MSIAAAVRDTLEKPKRTEKKQSDAEKEPKNDNQQQFTGDENSRVVPIPLQSGFEALVKVPRADFRMADLLRMAYGLLVYTSDWNPSERTPKQVFAQLEDRASTSVEQ